MVEQLNAGIPFKRMNSFDEKIVSRTRFEETLDEWRAYLASLSDEALFEWYNYIGELREEREKTVRIVKGLGALRRVYNQYKSSVDPDFNEDLVVSKDYGDDGYDASYSDVYGNQLQAKARLLPFLDGGYDLFIDVVGQVGEHDINETT